MKNFNCILLFAIFAMAFSTPHSITTPSNNNPITFSHVLDTPRCFHILDFPIFQLALNQLLEEELGYSTCVTFCPFPPYGTCYPYMINATDMEHSNSQWCFDGTLDFEWVCSSPLPPAETDAEGEGDVDLVKNQEEWLPTSNDKTPLHSILTVFPNPSTGLVTLDLALEKTDARVWVTISDWMGQVLSQKEYEASSAQHLHETLDFSKARDGLYFATVSTNKLRLETIRFLIQK